MIWDVSPRNVRLHSVEPFFGRNLNLAKAMWMRLVSVIHELDRNSLDSQCENIKP